MGLFLLRLTLAGGLFVDATARLHDPAIARILPALGEIPMGALLVIGLWTPITGIAVCLLQFAVILTTAETLEPPLQRAAVALCLALLGPGAWSIDARLFGRRRVKIRSFHQN